MQGIQMWWLLWESLVIGTHPGPSEEYVEDFLMPQTVHGTSVPTSWGLFLESDSCLLPQNTSRFFLCGASRGSFHCDWNTSRCIQNHRCGIRRDEAPHGRGLHHCSWTQRLRQTVAGWACVQPTVDATLPSPASHSSLCRAIEIVSGLIIHLTSWGFRSVLDKDTNPIWSRKPCPAFAQCCPPRLCAPLWLNLGHPTYFSS